ncbi:exonuclease domain-containing protein [Phenylobacterium sp.]|uniref:exonuclease domain-containing protein n=1 Tax=Phenylobacterium sp. TaxID=1871053 RepID=UPI0035AF48BF
MGWLKGLFGVNRVMIPEFPLENLPSFDFVAIDVETAARGYHTICQVGLVGFKDDEEVFAREVLIDPDCAFENTHIHGIDAAQVRGAPGFRAIYSQFRDLLSSGIVVSHSQFDSAAMRAACRHHGVAEISARWVDSAVAARVAWPDLANHKLPTLAAEIGHQFRHHSAVEDARACGLVMLEALRRTGFDLLQWVDRPAVQGVSLGAQSVQRKFSSRVARAPSAARVGGAFDGEVVVLTGDFELSKAELADAIAAAGGEVAANVTRKTTILVVGDRDPSNFGGKAKSGKQQKADDLIARGQAILIWAEGDLRSRLGS